VKRQILAFGMLGIVYVIVAIAFTQCCTVKP
jgi:hypothetical protein